MKASGLVTCLASLLLAASCTQKSAQNGFAIVIDQESYSQAKVQIDTYVRVVENRGLKPYLIIDKWGVPDSIRQQLKMLYNAKKNPIEGCVLIGDIPVPMVRDAQHFTTAFKMNQNSPAFTFTETCVPSDRYYDSFDLEWDFIRQDEERSEYFYYSLRADCSQTLKPTIYSARIMPRNTGTGDKYEKLRRYMDRVNTADQNNNPLDNIFYFSGQGFISESVDARIDEKAELYDHFPYLKKQHQAIEYVDHKREKFIKTRLINQMQYPTLDFAVLHHHGDATIEYLSDYPEAETSKEDILMMQRYMREQMREGHRKGMTEAEVKRRVRNFFECDIPDSWFNGALDPEQIAKDNADDEIEEDNINLHYSDFSFYHPQCRVVSLDACYNGSFHKDESIQEGYLFTEGNGTIAVMANTVNVLQDKWANRYIGLLGMGMRVGQLARINPYLEQHVFGDPTFAFTPSVNPGFDVNHAVASERSESFWKKQLNSQYADIQMIAMDRLSESNNNYSDAILDVFKNSPSGIVRLAAMLDLGVYRDDNYVTSIALALSDAHEMTQRLATTLAGHNGDSRLVMPMVELACKNNTSERIEFDLSSAFETFDSTAVMAAFDEYYPTVRFYNNPDSIGRLIRHALHSYVTNTPADTEETIFDTSLTETQRISGVRTLRNNNIHALVPKLLDYLSEPDKDNVLLQTCLWEALGWYTRSIQADAIAAKALEMSSDNRFDARVRNEALKTYNRVR